MSSSADEYEPSQVLDDWALSPPLSARRPHRAAALVAQDQGLVAQLYAPGGALDSQTSDTQFLEHLEQRYDNLGGKPPSASPALPMRREHVYPTPPARREHVCHCTTTLEAAEGKLRHTREALMAREVQIQELYAWIEEHAPLDPDKQSQVVLQPLVTSYPTQALLSSKRDYDSLSADYAPASVSFAADLHHDFELDGWTKLGNLRTHEEQSKTHREIVVRRLRNAHPQDSSKCSVDQRIRGLDDEGHTVGANVPSSGLPVSSMREALSGDILFSAGEEFGSERQREADISLEEILSGAGLFEAMCESLAEEAPPDEWAAGGPDEDDMGRLALDPQEAAHDMFGSGERATDYFPYPNKGRVIDAY
ncbi:hypothetical protein C8Q78DRAFT_994416 [Trametes maxima]|nr:hypothetical protein C8Q78DRAFT_994416 [Trametes maxima]